MSKKLKISIIVLAVLCILVDALWIFICVAMPDKTSLNTFNVSGLTGTVDSNGDKIPIIEVNYYANADNNPEAVEMFEIKLNYFCNTETLDTYSTGIQLINPKFGGGLFEERFNFFGNSEYVYAYTLDCPTYYYNLSGDVSYTATSAITEKESFLITIGESEDKYLMSFNNNEKKFDSGQLALWHYDDLVRQDIVYFFRQLYTAVESLDYGIDGRITFEFLDIFDYQKQDSSGAFVDIADVKENEKLKAQFINYYNIKVNTHKDGATLASQSLFNQIEYNSNYCSNPLGDTTSYFTGSTVYYLTEYDFDYINTYDNYYYFKVKDEVVDYLLQFKNLIVMLDFDFEKLQANDVYYYGLSEDSRLGELNVVNSYILDSEGNIEEVSV